MSGRPKVVVSGAGIIGASTAYYLALHGMKPIVIDSCSPACGASGKAGGFLALDWCDGSEVGALARKSFALHAQLARDLGVDYGYRKMRAYSASLEDNKDRAVRGGRRRGGPAPAWVDTQHVKDIQTIGKEDTVAQVHPKLLTEALLDHVVRLGGSVKSHTKAEKLQIDTHSNKVTGLETSNNRDGACDLIEADIVVFAMGAWTTEHLKHIVPDEYQCTLPTVSGLKVHSIVLQDKEKMASEDALFLRHGSLEPEVYPRPDGTVYICGVQSDEPLPALASMVEPEAGAIRYLRGSIAGMVSDALGDRCHLLQSQACYLPCSSSSKPVIGKLPGVDGAFVAAGHSCWGILLGPATGLGLLDMILESLGKESQFSGIDLGPFKP
eukprot:jgi/Picsp_1/1598/NSC_05076-R1_fad-dependent oxidoreductase-like protein